MVSFSFTHYLLLIAVDYKINFFVHFWTKMVILKYISLHPYSDNYYKMSKTLKTPLKISSTSPLTQLPNLIKLPYFPMTTSHMLFGSTGAEGWQLLSINPSQHRLYQDIAHSQLLHSNTESLSNIANNDIQ